MIIAAITRGGNGNYVYSKHNTVEVDTKQYEKKNINEMITYKVNRLYATLKIIEIFTNDKYA